MNEDFWLMFSVSMILLPAAMGVAILLSNAMPLWAAIAFGVGLLMMWDVIYWRAGGWKAYQGRRADRAREAEE